MYKEKEYDVLFELKGISIKENRRNLGCKDCENNVYAKDINKYIIEKENYEKMLKRIKEKIDKIIKDKN